MVDDRKYGTNKLFANEPASKESLEKLKAQRIKDEISKTLRQARNSLFVVGGIIIVFNIIQSNINSLEYEGLPFYLLYLDVFIGLVFVGLGFATYKFPFPALLTGLILYVGLILLNAYWDPSSIASGIIMKVIIIVYLVKGLKNAKEVETKRANFTDILDDSVAEDIDEDLLNS